MSIRQEDSAPISKIAEALQRIGPQLTGIDLWQDGSYNRVTLLETANLEVVAVYWRKGHCTPVHGHGASQCFFSVLEGSLEDLQYEKMCESSDFETVPLTAENGIQNEKGIHKIRCVSEKAISLHFYSPPISKK